MALSILAPKETEVWRRKIDSLATVSVLQLFRFSFKKKHTPEKNFCSVSFVRLGVGWMGSPTQGGSGCRGWQAWLVVLLLSCCLLHCASSVDSQWSFFARKEPVRIELKLNVILLGMDADGAFGYQLDPSSLTSLLAATLPSYRPSLMEEERLLNVEYTLRYDVRHHRGIRTYTELLGEELRNIVPPGGTGRYSVPLDKAEGLRNFFNSITVADEYSIILLGPCKRALEGVMKNSQMPDTQPQWHYSYNYGGGLTQSWVSEGRYVVVDLSAGPVVYGPSDVGEGTVSVASLPRIDKFYDKLKSLVASRTGFYQDYTVSSFAQIEAHLATTVISAIQYVFVPDIQFPAVQAEKVLIPIVVLRNHIDFNPWNKGHHYSIDLDTIREEVNKLVLPNQEVTLIADLHGLHEHKHISLALAKAHKIDNLFESDTVGHYVVKEKPYIDGRTLLQQMKDAQDIITSGFLQTAEERAHLSSAFFSRAHPAMPDDQNHQQPANRLLGTRILPVYVFSLLLSSHLHDILLDKRSLYKATPEGVVVLQTNSTNVKGPFFVEHLPVLFHPNNPTRHIIAGIAAALGALNMPFQRYSPLHARVQQSHLWSNGHHPFGPYATTTGLSRIYVDMVMRNSIVSRLDQALNKIHKAIARIDQFAKRYLYDPFGENITMVDSYIDYDGTTLDLEHGLPGTELWQGLESERSSDFRPLPVSTVERLYGEMDQLESMFQRINGLLREYNLSEAYQVSGSVELAAAAFAQYVQDEIRSAELELTCCTLLHIPTHTSIADHLFQYILMFIFVAILILGLVLFLKKKPRRKQSAQSRRR